MTRTEAITDTLENLGVTIVDVNGHTIDFTAEDADGVALVPVIKALPLLGYTLDYDKYGDLEGGRLAVRDPQNQPRG